MFKRTSPCDRPAGRGRGLLVKVLPRAAAAAAVALAPLAALSQTDLSSIPLPTFSAGTTVDVKPNILFVLDDSGSMDWDFLPDWAKLNQPSSTIDYTINYTKVPDYLFKNPAFNGVAYNPAVTYSPPVTFTSSGTAKDTSVYPSMDGTSSSRGGDSSATAASPNWNKVKNDAYGVQDTGTTNLTGNAFYYTVVPGEYCSTPGLTSCTVASAPQTGYQYAAMLRWCDSAALTNCKALPDDTFKYPRIPAPRVVAYTFSGASSAAINSITVAGQQILAATPSSSSTNSTVASRAATQINACSNGLSGNCQVAGYAAISSGSTLYIISPDTNTSMPVLTNSGTLTITVASSSSSFAKSPIPLGGWLTSGGTQSTGTIPGENLRTIITSANNSYPKASGTRADCAADTSCTYKEEMTNYANWWAYYHTRMQMMKTSATLAFANLDTDDDIAANKTRYRVGYFSLNNNTGTDMVNITDFTGTAKVAWFSKFLKANPSNGTGLRVALSQAGRMYGGKLNGSSLNGVSVVDPVQFSCQRNYTILSTDGFWNGNAGYKLDGSTGVGNQDKTLSRPLSDGYTPSHSQQQTSQLQTRVDTQVAQKGTLQKQTSQQQIQTLHVQSQTTTLSKSTSTLQVQTTQLQKSTSSLQIQTSQLQKTTWQLQSNIATDRVNYAGWNNVTSCTWRTSGTTGSYTKCQYVPTVVGVQTCSASGTKGTVTTNGTQWNGPAVTCATVVTSAFQNTGSCTTDTTTDASGFTTQCAYTGWSGWSGSQTCSNVAQSSGPNYTVGTAVQCQTVPSGYANATGACTVTTSNDTNGITTQCRYTSWSSFAGSPTCTAAPQSTAPNYTVVNAVQCQTTTSGFADANSCAATTTPDANGKTTQCTTRLATAWAGAQTCTDSNGAANSSGVITQCQNVVTTPWANATASCSPTSPNSSGTFTQCQYVFAPLAGTSTCAPAYTAGTFTSLTVYGGCTIQPGAAWTNAATCTKTSPASNGTFTNCQYTPWPVGWDDVTSCTAVNQSAGPNYTVGVAKQCRTVSYAGTSDTLADVAAYYYNTDLRNASQTGVDKTGPCTSAAGDDLCANNVIPYGRDTATWQHMTVHTLGLGAQGQMVFSPYQNNAAGQKVFVPDYWSQPSGDFYSVANGSTADSNTCTWWPSGTTCTWPEPAADSIANIDDLWHAAVNGHGTYFSATDPASLASGLSAVLAQIINTPRPGTAAAAASSNPNITSSDNYVFSSSYQSVNWFGELIMQRFNDDGSLTAQQWSAMQLLDCAMTPWQSTTTYTVGQVFNQGGSCYLVKKGYTSGGTFSGGATGNDGANLTALTGSAVTRKILVANSGSLVPFTYSNLTSTQQGYFSKSYLTYSSASQGLSQFCSSGSTCLDSTAQDNASGATLVSYLSGDRSNEGGYYRARLHVLGDIVSSEARYVKQPLQNYVDANYSAFVSAKSSRGPTVYVGANDGMLHAFNALTGEERWAFVPTAVLPNLYKLADLNYATNHQYFVDGTSEVGDICPKAPSGTCSAAEWRTILVGGLNQGGKSFYALDVTDPDNPAFLWEFTDTHLGFSYGNPRITKLADGTWVVMVASGYNNDDGVGRLYMLNASTGVQVAGSPISTGVGTATNQSGLAKIAARASASPANNTVDEVYGGDLLGNLWRFDVNGTIGATGQDAQQVIQFKDPSGNVQPITSKPVVANVNGTPLIMVGTGEYLGKSDLESPSTSNVYSMYAVKYAQSKTAALTTPRSNDKFVAQTLTSTTCPAGASTNICDQGQSVLTASNNTVDWAINDGWYFDFVNGGERSVTDATLALGTLTFTTIKPQTSTTGTITACTGTDSAVAAQSFLYYVNYLTGGPVAGTQGVVGELLCTCVATRPSVVKTQGGTVEGIIRMSGGGVSTGTDMGVTTRQDLPYSNTGGPLRRTSWRELNGD